MAIYHIPAQDTPLAQGDIFKNVPYWRPHRKTKEQPWPDVHIRGNLVIDLQRNQYAVLATQTCDINNANDLLFVVATLASDLLVDLEKNPEHPITEVEFRHWFVKNLHPRYHYFEQFKDENENLIIPEIVANFRRPFTMRQEYVIEKLIPDGHRILSLESSYIDDFGNRFGYYYSRVATNRDMKSL